MNKLVLGISTLLLSPAFVSGQHAFNPQNAREGEKVEFCHQHTKLDEIRTSDPALYQQIMADQIKLETYTRNYVPEKSETVYTIPVVFHILHNGGAENISDDQIHDAVAILNRDYRLLNSDANNVHPDFQGMPADVYIEFKLATIAPNGQCFKGITRTQSPLTNSSSGMQQLSAVFNNNDVYQGTWPHNKYLNVVVAQDIGGAAGYTMYPNDGGAFSNSIFILHNYLGSFGTGAPQLSRALTHEIGHWLNLSHTWGNTNNPGVACGDDGVPDTPITKGFTSCPSASNAAICDPNIVENYENYMDYSYCSKMFTPGQVTRMRAAITSSTGGRNNIWKAANLTAVGAIDNPPLCKADFSASKRVICVGETVQFTDESYNTVSGWSWSFQGGSPATSTAENPSVTYAAAGTYQVSLTASSGGATQNETRTAYITVIAPEQNLPFHEGFENYNTIADAGSRFFVESMGNNVAFQVTNTAGHTGSKSVKLDNYSQAAGNIDNLISGTIDLSNETINNVTFSYRYAHRKRANGNAEHLKAYFSGDCGDAWVLRTLPAVSSLSSSPVAAGPWTPTSADWKTVHIPFNTVAYNAYLTENFRFKFEFTSDGGNNLYIDDINLYRGGPSEEVVLGLEDKDALTGISLFPNPNDGEAQVVFSLEAAQSVTLRVMDISGKELKSTKIQANAGENVIVLDNSDFASGLYLIRLETSGSNKTLQFVKK